MCSCPMNYSGKTCDTRVWCVSDPCVMGSQCVDLPDGYECKFWVTQMWLSKVYKEIYKMGIKGP